MFYNLIFTRYSSTRQNKISFQKLKCISNVFQTNNAMIKYCVLKSLSAAPFTLSNSWVVYLQDVIDCFHLQLEFTRLKFNLKFRTYKRYAYSKKNNTAFSNITRNA